MKLNNKILALASVAAFGLSGQAMAIGTAAGTPITNEVTLNFKVGGATQVELKDDTGFMVDNKIIMALENNTPAANTTAPGAIEIYTFRLRNDGNKTQTFKLNLENTSVSTSTDIAIPSVTYAITTQNVGTSTLSTDEMTVPVDGDVSYTATFVFPTQTTAPVPVNIVDAEVYNILSTATAVTSAGGTITPDVATDKNDPLNLNLEELVVFAEGATTDSVIYDGIISTLASSTIATASIGDGTGTGSGGPGISVKVINDEICDSTLAYVDYSDGSGNTCPDLAGYTPKALPGALIEYTVTTKNNSTTTDADHLQFTHTLPSTEQTLANVKVLVDSVDVTSDNYDYGSPLLSYTVNSSTASDLAVNIQTLVATKTAVITFTAIVK